MVVPFDLLGGPSILNAKRPLNTFAADLSPILRRYFLSTPQENIHEIAEKAYVSSNEVTEYDRVLESLLKERLAFRQHAIVKPLEPKKHQEPNVARAIATFDQERPPQGQLQIIQGPVGSGKSLFARRYKDGQINRLKMIKRQMYGRAGFQLLRARVLPYSALGAGGPAP